MTQREYKTTAGRLGVRSDDTEERGCSLLGLCAMLLSAAVMAPVLWYGIRWFCAAVLWLRGAIGL